MIKGHRMKDCVRCKREWIMGRERGKSKKLIGGQSGTDGRSERGVTWEKLRGGESSVRRQKKVVSKMRQTREEKSKRCRLNGRGELGSRLKMTVK